MVTRYLLDSDIVITMLRDRSDESGLRAHALNIGLEKCYVSAISLAEIYSGAYKMSSERGLHEAEYIKTLFNILPYGEDRMSAPEAFGKCKSFLTSSGESIGDMDLLIGSSALAADMVMVTHNTRHFSRIPDLRIEDWLA